MRRKPSAKIRVACHALQALGMVAQGAFGDVQMCHFQQVSLATVMVKVCVAKKERRRAGGTVAFVASQQNE